MRRFLLSLVALSIPAGSASAAEGTGIIPFLIIKAQQKQLAELQAEANSGRQRVEAQRYRDDHDMRARELRLREQEVEIKRQYLELELARHREQSRNGDLSNPSQRATPPSEPYGDFANTPSTRPTSQMDTTLASRENEEEYVNVDSAPAQAEQEYAPSHHRRKQKPTRRRR
jgi:hypothetical protein